MTAERMQSKSKKSRLREYNQEKEYYSAMVQTKNSRVSSYKDIIPILNDRDNKIMCAECSKAVASTHCKQCAEDYCTSCNKELHSILSFRSHEIQFRNTSELLRIDSITQSEETQKSSFNTPKLVNDRDVECVKRGLKEGAWVIFNDPLKVAELAFGQIVSGRNKPRVVGENENYECEVFLPVLRIDSYEPLPLRDFHITREEKCDNGELSQWKLLHELSQRISSHTSSIHMLDRKKELPVKQDERVFLIAASELTLLDSRYIREYEMNRSKLIR